jgi:hypothetical protein
MRVIILGKRYGLQKIIAKNSEIESDNWEQLNIHSNSLDALKLMCPIGYRIIDSKYSKVTYDPAES